MSNEWDEYLGATRIEKESEAGSKTDPPCEPKEVVKEIVVEHETVEKVIEKKQVPVRDTVIEKVEVIKEVPVIKEVVKEVPVEKIVYRDRKPGTKVTFKEFELGKIILWLTGGLITLAVLYGGKWVMSQEFGNLIPKKDTISTKIPPKTVVKWKTKWKTKYKNKYKTIYKTDNKAVKENKRLKENLSTAYERIRILREQINTPRQVTCRYRHKLKIINSRK